MKAFLFLIYLAAGAGAGWSAYDLAGIDWMLAVGAGGLVALLLGQIHLFLAPSGGRQELEAGLGQLRRAASDASERLDVIEARTDAVEATLKHELTERRDALVTEMKQLEALMDRLSRSFESGPGASPPRISGADPMLAEVTTALENDRVDLHLQPVVALPQRRVAFYEGFARLRGSNGGLIGPGAYLDAARRAGQIGLIDALTLFRCVQIARRLVERERKVGLFCNISAASLSDDNVFPKLLEFVSEHKDLCGAMVFELPADRFETRNRTVRENMDKLKGLGFRFSIDQVHDLALDLPRLQDAGVRFAKIEASALLGQLRDEQGPRPVSASRGTISGEDVSAVFSRYGVTLVADQLEDEAHVPEILEYDIPYGQGGVFGAPRPIKASLMEETAPPPDFRRRIGAPV